MRLEVNKIYCGDCLEILKTFPDESINCVITSPPYWRLRDYGVVGQVGLESDYGLYISNLINVMAECKRVLKKDGTIWVNIGDSYSGSGKGINSDHGKAVFCDEDIVKTDWKQVGIPSKSLIGIPERFALAMTDELGLIRRNTIIWHKPNCMPSSATDRFTVDFEYVYFFTKSGKYWFEQQKEPAKYDGRKDTLMHGSNKYKTSVVPGKKEYTLALHGHERWKEDGAGNKVRNPRCVWTIPTKPFPESHFATFPTALIEPMIKSGCPQNGIVLDPFMGSGTTGVTSKLLNRYYIGIELNPEYIKIAEKRIKNTFYQESLAV